jgi:hypothetical protein
MGSMEMGMMMARPQGQLLGRILSTGIVAAAGVCLLLATVCVAPLQSADAYEAACAQHVEPERSGLGDYKVTEPKKVYYGNARLFKKPAVIDADRVYRGIPEYKKILDKGLTDRDPEYHLLMKKASARFSEAVKRMARDLDHDLVAESGAIEKAREDAKSLVDRTDDVIANIR